MRRPVGTWSAPAAAVLAALLGVAAVHSHNTQSVSGNNDVNSGTSSASTTFGTPPKYTVLNNTDFLGAFAYSAQPAGSIDDCARQCLLRPNCVATSWNGPTSHYKNRLCNFDCKLTGKRVSAGETAAVMAGRAPDLCNHPTPPPPPPPPTQPPPPLPSEWADAVASGWMLAAAVAPSDSDLCPTYGNGFLAATLCAPAVRASAESERSENSGGTFLSGAYDGRCPTPVNRPANMRATLPSPHPVVGVANSTFVGMALDMQNGTVLRRYAVGGECEVELTSFAHRSIRHLMVFTVRAVRLAGPCVVTPVTHVWAATNATCTPTEQGAQVRCTSMFVPETDRQVQTTVAMVADAIPPSFTLTASQPERVFLAAFATNLEPDVAALDVEAVALRRWAAADAQPVEALETSHRDGWGELWQSGLEVGGNVTVTAALRSSLYYVLSAVRADWAFGSSPGGLASTSYDGHAFWDMETWYFPPLAALFPDVAASITAYRRRLLPEAQRLAAATGYPEARFPWQSAATGAECSPSVGTDPLYWTKEVHITPDIVLAHRTLYRMTRNNTWLRAEAWPLISNACHYLASLMVLDQASGNYTILHVLPTTEAGFVDHPAYTTAASALSLQFCVDTADTLSVAVPANWSEIAERPYLPLNTTAFGQGPVHQVYTPYNGGGLAQAGVALLQYPLQLPMDSDLARRDLEYYGTKFSFSMMFFGQLTYAINWLRFGQTAQADAVFELAFAHQVGPWNVWREHAATPGQQAGGGAVNFLTGAGAFLQAFIFGYGGVSPTSHGLNINPVLPVGTPNASIAQLTLSACSVSIEYDANRMRLSCSASGCAQIVDSTNTTHPVPGPGSAPLVLARGAARLDPISST